MIVNKQKEKKKFSRYNIFIIIMGFVFTAIVVKLIYIQIYKNQDYKDKANTTATRFVAEKAPRGKIYDQNGNIFATNVQTFSMTYTATDIADKEFYSTVDSLAKVFAENSEVFQDDLMLKLDENNNWYLEYKSSDATSQKFEDIRFKRDRGMNESIEKELFDGDTEDLSDSDIEKVDNLLLEITPQDVFYYLVKSYDLISLVDPEPKESEDNYEEKKKSYDERRKKYIDKKTTGEELAKIITEKYSYRQIREYLVIKDAIKIQSLKGYKTVTLANNINKDTSSIIYQMLNNLPGVDVALSPTRKYPYNNLASSVLGYLSKIDEGKKNNFEIKGYDASSDLIGVSGIESSFEEQLKGVKGGTTVKVNPKGRVTNELFKLESYPGNNVHLTIDKDMQWAVEQSLVDVMAKIRSGGEYPNANRGAAIAVEVKTGRILSLVSYPDYDPNKFAVPGTLSKEEIQEYFSPDLESFGKEYISRMRLNKSVDDIFPKDSKTGIRSDDKDIYPRPFYNYATLGLIPPGSTFKPMTGIAALESGAIGINETVNDTHVFNIHPEVYGDEFDPTCLGYHGPISLNRALEESCNFYFYELAHKMYMNSGKSIKGLDSIANYAWKFGLGTDPNGKEKPSTGIEIEENFGQVYNFQSYKTREIAGSKFDLAEKIEAGAVGGQTFVPLDYSYNDDDSEKLRQAKKDLKDKITSAFNKVGTNEAISNVEGFSKILVDDIKSIMKNSEKYASNINEAEKKGRKIDTDKQAKVIADGIGQYVIFDRAGLIRSPAQAVYAAIGQGMDNFTPMQLAQYVSTIANGGTRYKLHLVDKITNPDDEIVQEFKPEILGETGISKSTLDAIKAGMAKVNMEEGGTAKAAWMGFPISTGGKTGTADSSDKQEEYGRSPYATYVSFAPLNNPEIAFVGVVYDGGHGGSIASVARTAFEAYFKDSLLKDDPSYASKSETFQKFVLQVPPDNKVTK
ncbi:penicillin-binding transpeptidase domain-containing protein [Clostridium sp. LP20]|uniref:penicillin-binding transpeptidase domain-containing protein n=1 Tax=Clostridium sp. LP20 TaxID=3418665 RepID=UPI003EE62803